MTILWSPRRNGSRYLKSARDEVGRLHSLAYAHGDRLDENVAVGAGRLRGARASNRVASFTADIEGCLPSKFHTGKLKYSPNDRRSSSTRLDSLVDVFRHFIDCSRF